MITEYYQLLFNEKVNIVVHHLQLHILYQGFKGRLNVRRLMVDKSLDQGKRCLEELTAERSGESPSKQRVATSLQRQFDIVSDRWLNLCTKSEEWQKRLDEALRVSVTYSFILSFVY